jgi:hypothetical protein
VQVATKSDLQAMSRDIIDFSLTRRGLMNNQGERQTATWQAFVCRSVFHYSPLANPKVSIKLYNGGLGLGEQQRGNTILHHHGKHAIRL